MQRTDPELQYQLGQLQSAYDDLTADCEYEHCRVYEIITNPGARTKPFLRGVARERAHIDALQYLTDRERPPHDPEWLSGTARDVLMAVNTELGGVVNESHETQSVRVGYLLGWRNALRYALDPEHRPFDANVFREPDPELTFTNPQL